MQKREAKLGTKLGAKLGAKLGTKLGAKLGAKLGVKRALKVVLNPTSFQAQFLALSAPNLAPKSLGQCKKYQK